MTQAEDFIHLLATYGKLHPSAMIHAPGKPFTAWQARFFGKLESLRGPQP